MVVGFHEEAETLYPEFTAGLSDQSDDLFHVLGHFQFQFLHVDEVMGDEEMGPAANEGLGLKEIQEAQQGKAQAKDQAGKSQEPSGKGPFAGKGKERREARQ